MFLSTNGRYNKIKVRNQFGCCGIKFAKVNMRSVKFKLKNYLFKQNSKNGNRSIVTNSGSTVVFKR